MVKAMMDGYIPMNISEILESSLRIKKISVQAYSFLWRGVVNSTKII